MIQTAEQRTFPAAKVVFTATVFVSGCGFGLAIWALMDAIGLDDLVRVSEKAMRPLVEAHVFSQYALGLCAVAVVIVCAVATRYHVIRR